jgi:hypothetical protein
MSSYDRRLGLRRLREDRQELDPEGLRRCPHGVADTHKEQLKADLLAFLEE